MNFKKKGGKGPNQTVQAGETEDAKQNEEESVDET